MQLNSNLHHSVSLRRTCMCLIFFNLFIFNWRIIALQNFVVFCQTSAWISHRYMYMYVPSLFNLPPIFNLIPWGWGKECCGVSVPLSSLGLSSAFVSCSFLSAHLCIAKSMSLSPFQYFSCFCRSQCKAVMFIVTWCINRIYVFFL